MNKENTPSTPSLTRKRAKSFSTPPTVKAVTRGARGILKGNNGEDAHTIAFIPIHSHSKKSSDSAEKRRKSLSRRVSFASHAAIRVFEKQGDSSPLSTPRRSERLSPAKSPLRHLPEASPQSPSDSFGLDDAEGDELTMDLTNIIGPPTTRNADDILDNRSVSSEEEDESLVDDGSAMMDLTDVIPLSTVPTSAASPVNTPRRSSVPGQAKDNLQTEVYQDIGDNEETQAMDLTTVFGVAIPVMDPSSPFIASQEDGMDITRVVGSGIIQYASNSPALEVSAAHIQRVITKSSDDDTMNMDETHVFTSTSHRRQTIGEEDQTSQTSYTVATEEDSIQRLCEGSITQADGFTQNMHLTTGFPNDINGVTVQPGLLEFPSDGLHSGKDNVPKSNEILLDTSMADVTQGDESMNMDITQAVPQTFPLAAIDDPSTLLNEDPTIDMDMTRIVQPTKSRQLLQNTTTQDDGTDDEGNMSFTQMIPASTPHKIFAPNTVRLHTMRSPSRSTNSATKRRLSTGARRISVTSASEARDTGLIREIPHTPSIKDATPLVTPSSVRRKSMLESAVPDFGTPERQMLPNSEVVHKIGSGVALGTGQDRRLTILKGKIEAMTPKRGKIELPESLVKMTRLTTPRKTPQRTLLQQSLQEDRSAATTPVKIVSRSEVRESVITNEGFKTSDVSSMTGFSDFRRRETLSVPQPLEDQAGTNGESAQGLMAQKCVIPVLEMYQQRTSEALDQYRRADAVNKDKLEAQSRHLDTQAKLSAKGGCSSWRDNLVSEVLGPRRANLAGIEMEAQSIKNRDQLTSPVLERIQAEHDELKTKKNDLRQEELANELLDHEEVARAAKCVQVETRKVNASQVGPASACDDATLNVALQHRIAESETKRAEAAKLEAKAKKRRGYTRAEVEHLKQRYQTFTDETGLRILHVTANQCSLTLGDSLRIDGPLEMTKLTLSLLEPYRNNVVMQYYMAQISQTLSEHAGSVKASLQLIRDQWSLVILLTEEYRILESIHPTSIKVNEDDNLEATTCILLTASRTKFLAHFTSKPVLSKDDSCLEVAITLKYGCLDANKVQEHVQGKLHNHSGNTSAQGWVLESLRMPEGL